MGCNASKSTDSADMPYAVEDEHRSGLRGSFESMDFRHERRAAKRRSTKPKKDRRPYSTEEETAARCQLNQDYHSATWDDRDERHLAALQRERGEAERRALWNCHSLQMSASIASSPWVASTEDPLVPVAMMGWGTLPPAADSFSSSYGVAGGPPPFSSSSDQPSPPSMHQPPTTVRTSGPASMFDLLKSDSDDDDGDDGDDNDDDGRPSSILGRGGPGSPSAAGSSASTATLLDQQKSSAAQPPLPTAARNFFWFDDGGDDERDETCEGWLPHRVRPVPVAQRQSSQAPTAARRSGRKPTPLDTLSWQLLRPHPEYGNTTASDALGSSCTTETEGGTLPPTPQSDQHRRHHHH